MRTKQTTFVEPKKLTKRKSNNDDSGSSTIPSRASTKLEKKGHLMALKNLRKHIVPAKSTNKSYLPLNGECSTTSNGMLNGPTLNEQSTSATGK